MRKILLVILSFVSIQYSSFCKPSEYPEVGKRCPSFLLNNIQYYEKPVATLESFRGKWLVLDFFSVGCLTCFESFPKLKKLNAEFKEKVQFVLVGKEHDKIRSSFERYRKFYDLNIPVAYSATLPDEFGIRSYPHVIVIDDKGIVRAITYKIDHFSLEGMMQNPASGSTLNNVVFIDSVVLKYDSRKPLLINGNGGYDTSFSFRSILTEAHLGLQGRSQDFVNGKIFGNRVQVVGFGLSQLYDYAYGDTLFRIPDSRGSSYGRYWNKPILEVSDSSKFYFDFNSTKNRYNYSLIVPESRATSKFLQLVMRRDLQNYFGYDVVVEVRKMPCWKLIARTGAESKLLTKYSKLKFKEYSTYTGFSLIDVPMEALIRQIWLYQQEQPPILDFTGISSNISINIEAVVTDINDLNRALNSFNLQLVKGEIDMRVIVIRDPNVP